MLFALPADLRVQKELYSSESNQQSTFYVILAIVKWIIDSKWAANRFTDCQSIVDGLWVITGKRPKQMAH